MDYKSKMGYRKDSPYKNDPFIDIFSPEGKIDMSQTKKDLIGIDEYGNVQMMVGGRKQMYQFEGQQVREIPLDQLAKGGLTSAKAKKMLKEGIANGRKLTDKQKGYFGWVAGGKKQVGGSIPNLGYPGMLQEVNLEDALKESPNLKFTKNGRFKGLIPLEDWNDDVMNYIDKFKMVKRKGEPFVKVRGKIDRQQSPYLIPSGQLPTLQMGGNPYNSASNYLVDFLFEEDEPEQIQQPEVVEEPEIDLTELRRQEQEIKDEEDYNMAIQIAMQAGENPYSSESSLPTRAGVMTGTGTGGTAPAGFRTFGSYAEGRAALENQLNLYKTGRTKNPVKPTSTLYEAMSVYAPAADKNDPKNYANFIARKLGISVDTPIYKIDTGKWADAITIMEGNKKGNNPGNLRPSR